MWANPMFIKVQRQGRTVVKKKGAWGRKLKKEKKGKVEGKENRRPSVMYVF